MYVLRMAIRNVRRCGCRSFLCMLICAFATLLLNLYMGNIEDLRKTLQKLPEAMEVSAKISNLDGSMDQGLKIEAELVSNLLTSGHVSEPSVTVQLLAGFGFFSQEEWQANLTLQARGVNSLAGAGLRQENITLQEGSTLDFLAEDGQKCLLDRSVMEENGYVTGDTIPITVYYYRYGDYHQIFCKPLSQCEYEIAGTVDAPGRTEDVYPELILPIKAVENSYIRAGIPFLADSFSFMVKNPLELNAFKEEMHSFGLLPVSAGSELHYEGNALVVQDETFIKAAERIEENLTLLQGFFPLIAAITAGVGYLTAHLFVQNRRQEYALLRSAGLGRTKSSLMFFLEYVLLAVCGCVCGCLCAQFCMSGGWRRLLTAAVIFLGCSLPGTLAALISMGRGSVMQILTQKD